MKTTLRILALCAFVSLAFSACRNVSGGGGASPTEQTGLNPSEPRQPKSPEVIEAEKKVKRALEFGKDDAAEARNHLDELPTFEELKLVLESNDDLKKQGWCFVKYGEKLGIAWKDSSGEWKDDDEGNKKASEVASDA